MKDVRGFYKIWIGILFVCFVLFMLLSSSGQRPSWNPVEQIIIEITAPLQNFIKQTVTAAEDFWENYFFLVNLRLENRQLKRKVDALGAENSRYRELLTTHERLKDLLQFKEAINRPVLAAQVIGRDPTGWFKSIVIDKGNRAGLRPSMPVVNASGVVGRIVSISPNYAKVLLIIDQNSAVDCLIQRSRDRGIAKGASTEICKLDYVAKSSDVAVEDLVVTSGLGGVFPKGLPVGRISEISEVSGEFFKDIKLRPAVDFSKLEEVLVILKEQESSNPQEKKK